MMRGLNEYKRVFCVVGLIGVIICFVPSAIEFVNSPLEEPFSGLYVLGPGHAAENYPFNVSASAPPLGSYLVYLGVENHMGSSVCYGVDVKFRNASEPLPNGTLPSSLPVLCEYRVFLEDGQGWEGALMFSFSDVVFYGKSCFVGKVRVNDVDFAINKTAVWDNESSGFYYQLLVELWRYNQMSSELSYDRRYVALWLNMTSNK